MRVLAAVGNDEAGFEAGILLGRLAFKALSGSAVYVVDRLGTQLISENAPQTTDLITHFLQLQEDEGKKQLQRAADVLKEHGVRLEMRLKSGLIANELLKAASEEKVDLIAMGSRDETPLNKMLVGSVTRKLVVKSQQSLLVARNLKRKAGPIHAVLATDHSPYGNRCFDILLAEWPAGITDVTVVTAYPRNVIKVIGSAMANVKTDFDAMVERVLKERNAALQARLEKVGVRVKTVISAEPVADAIDQTVQSSGAELLILGAQGHGFVERLGFGSVSFEQVVAGKTSVLVLRAPS